MSGIEGLVRKGMGTMRVMIEPPGFRDAWEIFTRTSVGAARMGIGRLWERRRMADGRPDAVWVKAFIVPAGLGWSLEDSMVFANEACRLRMNLRK